MKYIRIYTIITTCALMAVIACKDESLETIPEWETAVHGLAEVTSDNTDFSYNDTALPIDIDLQWISIDKKLTVTKMEVYVLFDENYIDVDNNPAVAHHGGTEGRLFATFEGSSVPANRTPVALQLTQDNMYTLYQDAVFDYGNGEVSVFTNPDNPYRDAAHKFMWNDKMRVRWVYTTDDGRVFEKWAVSVCTEFPGANCQVDFTVVCLADIPNAEGTWTFDLKDVYGDGWQGGYIQVKVDGVEVEKIFLLSEYEPGGVPISAATYTFDGTAGTLLQFFWHEDDYQVETQFKITSPSGNVVADYKAGPTEGKIKLDLCLE